MAANGLLVIDKPTGITSRAAVNRVQQLLPRGTRIGHTGTLDPLATGVLVLCIGKATRLAEYVQAQDKTYHTRIRLGAVSNTDDADGVITVSEVATPPQQSAIEDCLRLFLGDIEQTPPAYSAIKIDGQRAYELARRGQETDIRPRRVHVHDIKLLSYAWPYLELEIRCGKGTYIRSLARDIGSRLGCGGHVEILRRTRVGPFNAADAVSLAASWQEMEQRLLPLDAALAHLPRITLSDEEGIRLTQGQSLRLPSPLGGEGPGVRGEMADEQQVAVFSQAAGLIAVAVIVAQKLRPVLVLKVN